MHGGTNVYQPWVVGVFVCGWVRVCGACVCVCVCVGGGGGTVFTIHCCRLLSCTVDVFAICTAPVHCGIEWFYYSQEANCCKTKRIAIHIYN